MEKKIYVCDRCGTELDVRDHIVIIRGNISTELMEKIYDFCPTCAFGVRAELDEVLKPKTAKRPYKKPEIIEEPPKLALVKRGRRAAAPVKKDETVKKENGKDLDIGKAGALYKTKRWSIKDIAEDMNTTEEVIEKALIKLGLLEKKTKEAKK